MINQDSISQALEVLFKLSLRLVEKVFLDNNRCKVPLPEIVPNVNEKHNKHQVQKSWINSVVIETFLLSTHLDLKVTRHNYDKSLYNQIHQESIVVYALNKQVKHVKLNLETASIIVFHVMVVVVPIRVPVQLKCKLCVVHYKTSIQGRSPSD